MQHHALYLISQIRQIETQAKKSLTDQSLNTSLPGSLMRTAGKAAAQIAQQILQNTTEKAVKRIAVLAGPGDNGGDAFEVAHQLAEMMTLTPAAKSCETQMYEIHVFIYGKANAYSEDAKKSLLAAQSHQIHWHTIDDQHLDQLQQDLQTQNPILPLNSLHNSMHDSVHDSVHSSMHNLMQDSSQYDLVIDGLFGIGLCRPITGKLAKLITQINRSKACPVLALDVPSGLNADTGQIISNGKDDAVALIASHTISFIANKPGLHTASGKDYAGLVVVDQLNIDDSLYPTPYAYLANQNQLSTLIKPRKQDSHKGSYGDVVIVGGCKGMQGAPLLAGRAALFMGAGRVYLDLIEPSSGIDYLHPEIMQRPAIDNDLSKVNLVIGPGLGDSPNALNHLRCALLQAPALVIDADALNLIASHPDLLQLCRNRSSSSWRTIITPHPLEAARLLNCSTTDVQANRCRAAQALVDKFLSTAILKGAGCIIAAHTTVSLADASLVDMSLTDASEDLDKTSGAHSHKVQIYINSSGNPALATAGTGDVLAGICGALLAQGLQAFDAACLAAHLHGQAADDWVQQNQGAIGLTASELIPAVRTVLNRLVYLDQRK